MAYAQRSGSRDSHCFRCGNTVYPVDRVGPLKDFTFFHTQCFKCAVCGTKLTLKNYFNNQNSQDDKEVYCQSHVPKIAPGQIDGLAVGIRAAMNVPKSQSYVNEQIRAGGRASIDNESILIKSVLSPAGAPPVPTNGSPGPPGSSEYRYGRYDASALHIQHALKQTEVQKGYPRLKFAEYLDAAEQEELERKQREEEDRLYLKFAKQREQEERRLKDEIKEEWEKELERLTEKFEMDINRKKSKDDVKQLTVRHQREKDEFERNMTLKRDKKKESLTRKLLEHERAATAALVDKHSKEMLSLINERKQEHVWSQLAGSEAPEVRSNGQPCSLSSEYPVQPPPPTPASHSKLYIYTDPEVFSEVDRIAIQVAQEDQKTFTDLIRQLVDNCASDIEKARTIFRWITVKNLNQMNFDDGLRTDTPMGLLRGIKYGTESYHVLFKRLCSYAGLHCVVIKGYSKSAGYQPGVKFEDNRFRNSWNAVYVAGAWRFVQCNWGARHLVNAKETPKPGNKTKSDSLRYEYDDHYFLTDAREFIYEFYPLQSEWQLLPQPLSLQQFEQLPFVRSLFFRYGLSFPDHDTTAVMNTDSTGAATIRIGMPSHMQSSLIFHYNLKFFNDDSDTYDGVSLKRFVMQSVVGSAVSLRVHAPTSGSLLLDIFANAVTPRQYLTGEPMKFKSVCKFQIVCRDLQTVMVPLPDCASGEWGPMKANRLFGLVPVTHTEALIFCNRQLEVQFRMSRPLTDFMATLHRNGFEERRLVKYVSHSVAGDLVTFTITFPDEGQYGMDVYTREVQPAEGGTSAAGGTHPGATSTGEKQLLTHCCKYLINSSRKN